MTNLINRHKILTQSAFTWQAEGVPVVPCLPKSKECRLHWRAYEAKPALDYILHRWFFSDIVNMAVVCGVDHTSTKGHGLVVLDFDNLFAWQAWQEKAGELAATYAETTGRGVHAFYKVDRPQSRVFDLCEVLGLGHLCLVYPSIHPTGKPYWVLGDPGTPIRSTTSDLLFSLLSKEQGDREPSIVKGPGPVIPGKSQAQDCTTTNNDTTGADLIGRIKAAYPLLSFANELTNMQLSRMGARRWYIGKCPLHEDKQPSMWIDAERQIWGCYAPDCKGHQGGDVINLFALAHGLTVQQAIKIMGEKIHAGR